MQLLHRGTINQPPTNRSQQAYNVVLTLKHRRFISFFLSIITCLNFFLIYSYFYFTSVFIESLCDICKRSVPTLKWIWPASSHGVWPSTTFHNKKYSLTLGCQRWLIMEPSSQKSLHWIVYGFLTLRLRRKMHLCVLERSK